MSRKSRWPVVTGIVLFALLVLGLATFLVHDCIVTHAETSALDAETARCEKMLAEARVKAREVVRAKLLRDEKATAKEDVTALAKLKASARRRRSQARRIFQSRGFTASAAYLRAVEMPNGDPAAEDQEIIDLAGEAASEVDLDTAADVAEAALKSADPRARIAAVEMLSGLGEAGLVDISEFLGDPHPDVANLAADRWELGIQDLSDAKEQAALAKVGFLAITDEDQLRSLGGTLMLVPDAKLAVDVLTEVIRDGAKVQRAAAREAYENVTGEKWVDEATATAWLAANYVPPDPEDEDSGGLSETTPKQEEENESE